MAVVPSWEAAFTEAQHQCQHFRHRRPSPPDDNVMRCDEDHSGEAVGHKNVMWVSVDVSSSTQPSETTAVSTGSTEPPTKRSRLDEDPSTSTAPSSSSSSTHDEASSLSSSSSPVSLLSRVDNALQRLFESMPPHSKLLVLTQRHLTPLRKLVAKRLRKRWDTQAANKKRVRVAMPKVHSTACGEWDNQVDEPKMLEEANAAARCCLFVRSK